MLEATLQRAFFVDAEIMPGLVSKQRDDLKERGRRSNLSGSLRVRGSGLSVNLCNNEFWNVCDRRDDIDAAGRDRATRHPIELGLLRILRDHETAFFLDRDKPDAAVRSGPRQHDAYGLLATRFGERSQEKVERESCAATFRRLRS